MKLSIEAFNPQTIASAVSELEKYSADLERKEQEICRRLATMGAVQASLAFSRAIYDGTPDFNIEVEQTEKNKFRVRARGATVLFVEFGTGVVHPDNHPLAGENGMIRGAYGKGNGSKTTWGYYGEPGDNGIVVTNNAGKSVVLTHGNPANMPMYNTEKDLMKRIEAVVREVLTSDRH